jgi:Mn-dependent DtxR family transcriptional regulator
MLSIRQRIIYSRLAPLRRPVAAYRLANMIGGLIDRRTITCHLHKLAVLGLAEKKTNGWIALAPSGDMEKQFVRTKQVTDDRWHGGYASWKMPLPLKQPFPGRRNGTELYAAYWLIYNLEYKKQTCGVKRLAALLGVTRLTARKLVMTLRDCNLLDGLKVMSHTWELRYDVENEGPAKEDVIEDPLDVLLRKKTGKDKIESLIEKLKGIMTRQDIYDMARDALKYHDPVKYPGDGSALLIHRLEERLEGRTALEAAAAAKSKAAQRDHDRRRSQQTRRSLADYVIPGDRAMLEAAFESYTDAQLDNADLALCGIRRQLTLAEVENVIRDPQAAVALKAPAVQAPRKMDVPVVKPVGKTLTPANADEDLVAIIAESGATIATPTEPTPVNKKPLEPLFTPEELAEICANVPDADEEEWWN